MASVVYCSEEKECNVKCRYRNTCTRNPLKSVNVLEKIQIVLSSLETEAEKCHNVAETMENQRMYSFEKAMKFKEEAYRDCIRMIKKELGMM